MRVEIEIVGLPPGILMHNGEAGLDTDSVVSLEIAELAAKKGSNRTAVDVKRLRELEAQRSLYLLTPEGPATIPPMMIRAAVENGARKTKQGPLVREGLVVESVDFHYDTDALGTTPEELGRSVQHTCGVVVQRNRILRTRALFPEWSAVCTFDLAEDLIDDEQLERFMEVAGRRVGVGDWRPEKSGSHGRFKVKRVTQLH